LGKEVPQEWLKIAADIVIPFDETLQIHPEFDGYHGETIKQADVVLLGFPLMYPMSDVVRYNDLQYYR
jgi:trehalose/maltose hydrolase-like predicted phosphorylase